MKQIKLTQGKFALVDDADFERLNQFKWQASKHNNKWYARRTFGGRKNKQTSLMHREILGLKLGEFCDHKDRDDTLNNQRFNIRKCTWAQNQMNRTKKKKTSSKHIGVYWNKGVEKWQAYIKVNKKVQYLGIFDKERDAAKARNDKAIELHGEFANLNKI